MELILRTFTLELSEPFKIARDAYTHQETVIVELKDGGYSGFGEATSKAYYGVSTDSIIKVIEANRNYIEATLDLTPEDFWDSLKSRFPKDLFALCALDMAYSDLYAKRKGLKLFEYWRLNPESNPLSNFTIGIASIEEMIEKVKRHPWPIYKIKLGTDHDIEIIQALRRHTRSPFRVDANCGWTPAQTIVNSRELKRLGVEFIEQPLKADNWLGHKEVFKHAELPIIADESCLVETDVDHCYQHFHGINVKLVKCGGLTPAKRMLARARSLNMKTMVGCMTESSIGISAIAHLAPLLDYVDMDGALLLKKDIAKGVEIRQGKIYFSKLNGIGAQLTTA